MGAPRTCFSLKQNSEALFPPQEDYQHHHQGLHPSSLLFLHLARTWSSKFLLQCCLVSPYLTLTNCSSKDKAPKIYPYSIKSKRLLEKQNLRTSHLMAQPFLLQDYATHAFEHLCVGTAPRARTARTPSPSWDTVREEKTCSQ